jgi:hypothetical protein
MGIHQHGADRFFRANNPCASREISRLLWNSKVYTVFNCTPSNIPFTEVTVLAYSFCCTFGYCLNHRQEDMPV